MKAPDNASYNAGVHVPRRRRHRVREGLASAVDPARISWTSGSSPSISGPRREDHAARDPLRAPGVLGAVRRAPPRGGLLHDPATFTWNKVLVFNLGFDRKGRRTCTGSTTRTASARFTASASTTTSSTGAPQPLRRARLREGREGGRRAMRARVLDDLRAEGMLDGHQLVASHSVSWTRPTCTSPKGPSRSTRD